MKIKNLLAFIVLPAAMIALVAMLDLSGETAATFGASLQQDVESIFVISLASLIASLYLLPALLKQRRGRAKKAALVPILALWVCIFTAAVALVGVSVSSYTLIAEHLG